MDRADSRKYHFIYKTTCLITGRWYIGMHSTNILDDGYLGSGKRLWYSIKKYGKENHTREIVEFCIDRKSLATLEKEIVNKEMLKEGLCMNLKPGGDGGIYLTNEQQAGINRTNVGRAGGFANRHKWSILTKEKCRAKSSEIGKYYFRLLWDNEKEKMLKGLAKAVEAAASTASIIKRKETFSNIGHQQGEKNSNYGKRNKCVSKDGVTKRIPLDEVENYLADGWILGIKK